MENEKLVPHDREYTPSHSKIFGYWKDKAINPDGTVSDILQKTGIEVIPDWGEPCCWACGKQIDLSGYKNYGDDLDNNRFSKIYGYAKTRNHLQRCHIVPHALGGSDAEDNFFLLCKECHEESPDTANPQNFLRWVYKKKTSTVFGIDFKWFFREIQEECDAQNKDMNTISTENALAGVCHGNKLSKSTIVYGLVDSCKPKQE